MPADREAEAGPAVPARRAGVDLCELLEDDLAVRLAEDVIGDRLGFISKTLMSQVDKALCLQLGIEETPGYPKG